MSQQNLIEIGNIPVSNHHPFTLFGGMNVLESRELALEVASAYKGYPKTGIPYVLRHPLIKRTAHPSPFRGLGLEKG